VSSSSPPGFASMVEKCVTLACSVMAPKGVAKGGWNTPDLVHTCLLFDLFADLFARWPFRQLVNSKLRLAVLRRGATGGTVSPLLRKFIFVNRLEPMGKNWGYRGSDVTNHILFSSWICHKGFSKTWSNLCYPIYFYYWCNEFIFCLLK